TKSKMLINILGSVGIQPLWKLQWFKFLHFFKKQPRVGIHQKQLVIVHGKKSFSHHGFQHFYKVVVKTVYVQKPDWFLMQPKLKPSYYFKKLFQSAHPAGKGNETVALFLHFQLALVHIFSSDKFG